MKVLGHGFCGDAICPFTPTLAGPHQELGHRLGQSAWGISWGGEKTYSLIEIHFNFLNVQIFILLLFFVLLTAGPDDHFIRWWKDHDELCRGGTFDSRINMHLWQKGTMFYVCLSVINLKKKHTRILCFPNCDCVSFTGKHTFYTFKSLIRFKIMIIIFFFLYYIFFSVGSTK